MRFSATNSIPGIDAKFRPIATALLDRVSERLQSRETNEAPETLYNSVLETLVENLLARFYPPEFSVVCSDKGLENLTAQEVGGLYEVLRGFRLEVGSGNQPVLMPCARGKRNSGLFYTPPLIVEHIVRRTLDALATSPPRTTSI